MVTVAMDLFHSCRYSSFSVVVRMVRRSNNGREKFLS